MRGCLVDHEVEDAQSTCFQLQSATRWYNVMHHFRRHCTVNVLGVHPGRLKACSGAEAQPETSPIAVSRLLQALKQVQRPGMLAWNPTVPT